MADWLNTDPGYYFGGGRWDLAAKPSVYEGAQRRRNIEREVDDLFARMLGVPGAEPATAGVRDDAHAAAHEAGHAYTSWSRGYDVESVILYPDGTAETALRAGQRLDADSKASVLLAGAIAERTLLGEVADGTDDDEAQLAGVMPDARPDVVGRTERLVSEGRAAIAEAARVLGIRRRLTGADLAAIFGRHGARSASAAQGGYQVRIAGPAGRTETRTAHFDEAQRSALDLRSGETEAERDARVAAQFGVSLDQVWIEKCAARSRVSVGAVREQTFAFTPTG